MSAPSKDEASEAPPEAPATQPSAVSSPPEEASWPGTGHTTRRRVYVAGLPLGHGGATPRHVVGQGQRPIPAVLSNYVCRAAVCGWATCANFAE